MCSPMGVDERLRSSASIGVPEACAVVMAVLMISFFLSMKPLDLGYIGDEVMCLMCCFKINLARSSAQKGGSVVNENAFRGP